MISISRVYGEISPGYRILVDRLWPRTIKKESIDYWAKEIAPSNELRKWYGHIPDRFEEFREKYQIELNRNPAVQPVILLCREQNVVLLYAAMDEKRNNAAVLKDWLEDRPEIRIERINEMENRLNRVCEYLRTRAGDVKEEVRILDEYYRSPLWRADFEADESGKLPAELPRGVLSEDAVYNALDSFSAGHYIRKRSV